AQAVTVQRAKARRRMGQAFCWHGQKYFQYAKQHRAKCDDLMMNNRAGMIRQSGVGGLILRLIGYAFTQADALVCVPASAAGLAPKDSSDENRSRTICRCTGMARQS
ncbi:MAG: hypothetical protein L0L41_08890, partial [Acetobacter sp.]|nr:hypothetical protein [Acetobacter sp.]